MAVKKATSKKKTAKKGTAKKKATKKGTKKKAGSTVNVWSARDIAYLKANYMGKTASQISKALGRTVNAVRAKATTLNLRKGVTKKMRTRR